MCSLESRTAEPLNYGVLSDGKSQKNIPAEYTAGKHNNNHLTPKGTVK